MDQLLPRPQLDIDPFEVVVGERRERSGRPWLVVNMVATVDGAIEIGGLSGPIGGEGDRTMFRALRAMADVILVAGGTARAEDYGPPVSDERVSVTRERRGQSPIADLAIISASVGFSTSDRVFADGHRPTIFTVEDPPPDRVADLDAVADLVRLGRDSVDPSAVLDALGRGGSRVVLCEGGPALNAQLIAADLVDEVCVTVAPKITAGRSRRLSWGDHGTVRGLQLDRVFTQDGELYLRYLRGSDAS
jgi:riboflavin biosynthesis pyrimidine reductase